MLRGSYKDRVSLPNEVFFLGKAADIVQMGNRMQAGTFRSSSSSRKRSLLLHTNVRIRRVFTVVKRRSLKGAHLLSRQIREQVIPPERVDCRRDSV
jgi:hypothetical protein